MVQLQVVNLVKLLRVIQLSDSAFIRTCGPYTPTFYWNLVCLAVSETLFL